MTDLNITPIDNARDLVCELGRATLSPEKATSIGGRFLSIVVAKVDLNSFTPFEQFAPELVLAGYEALVEQSLTDRRKEGLGALTEKLSPYAARALTVCDGLAVLKSLNRVATCS